MRVLIASLAWLAAFAAIGAAAMLGRRLAKRDNAASLRALRQSGIAPSAIIEKFRDA